MKWAHGSVGPCRHVRKEHEEEGGQLGACWLIKAGH